MGGNVPNHITAGFPIAQCSTCHDTINWADATFNHASTGFPLTNAHASVACAQCHVNGNYSLQIAPTDCGNSGCHLTTWQQTNNPNAPDRRAAFAAANCSHLPRHDRLDGLDIFNHSRDRFHPDRRARVAEPDTLRSLPCQQQLHLTIAPTDCGNSACHLTQWNSTATIGWQRPESHYGRFPDRAVLHLPRHHHWADSTFNHTSTGFALVGTHATTACAPATSTTTIRSPRQIPIAWAATCPRGTARRPLAETSRTTWQRTSRLLLRPARPAIPSPHGRPARFRPQHHGFPAGEFTPDGPGG